MATNKKDETEVLPVADEPDVTVPDAIIFIPGITQDPNIYPLDEIALLLANALDNADNIAKAKFRIGDVGLESFAKSGETQAATIFREQDGEEVAVVKVYGVNYSSDILGSYQGLPLILKFLALLFTLFPLARTWTSLRNSLSKREKLQFFLLTMVMLALFFYGVLLITSAVSSIGALQPSPDPTQPVEATPTPAPSNDPVPTEAAPTNETNNTWVDQILSPISKTWSDLNTLLFKPAIDLITAITAWLSKLVGAIIEFAKANGPQLVLWATLLGLVIPTRAQVQEALGNSMTILMATVQYLWLGRGRPRVRGQLNSLLQDILESPETQDSRIHILTHSFGSIVAMDTLFRSDLDAPPSFKNIHSLVTIGSPFDFIEMMWPHYFEGRKRIDSLHWINIFAPQDVLSSNFLKRSKAQTISDLKSNSHPYNSQDFLFVGLEPKNLVYRPTDAGDELGIIDIFTFLGLRSHLLYWERGKKSHSNAFDLAIPEMFDAPPVG